MAAAHGWAPPEIDTTVAHPARVYDYLIGGKDHYAVDRAVADAALRVKPRVRDGALANRAFLRRAVRAAATEFGVDQFLDLGTGIPGPGNTGEVARAVHPAARVVYVDNDPIVAAHSRALLSGADAELTGVVLADVRDPAAVLADPAVARVLDLRRPVAVLMLAVLHFLTDKEDPKGVVDAFADALVPGSVLILSHVSTDPDPEQARAVSRAWDRATAQLRPRPLKEIDGFLAGWEVQEPGLTRVSSWRPDGPVPEWTETFQFYGALGVKR
jgi:hypothetical protein